MAQGIPSARPSPRPRGAAPHRSRAPSFAGQPALRTRGDALNAHTGRQTYRRPDWFTRKIFNPLVAGLARAGVSVLGTRLLEVRGRKTGRPRRTPVNLLTVGDRRYLVAPRGETQWVRNLRAAGEGELLLGRRRERFHAVELADGEKEPVLRAYLRRWTWEVGRFFGGVRPDSPAAELARIASAHPVFRVER